MRIIIKYPFVPDGVTLVLDDKPFSIAKNLNALWYIKKELWKIWRDK